MTKSRDPWIDNIKGILIIFVVIGHMIAPAVSSYRSYELIYKLINSFHMPCFMFLTGYLSKRKIDERDYKQMVLRTGIPYFSAQFFIWAFCCLVPYGMELISYQSTKKLVWLIPNYHLWFLLAIFLFSMITPVFLELFEKRKWMLLILAFVCSMLVGYCKGVLYLRLTKNIAYYPLFLAGYFYKKEWMQDLKEKKNYKIAGIFILLVWGLAIWRFLPNISVDIFSLATAYKKYADPFKGNYPVIARGVYLIGSLIVSMAFMSLMTRKNTFFTYVGEHSLYVYILHAPVLFLIKICNAHVRKIYAALYTPGRKIIFLIFCIVLAFVLAADPIVKIFRHFFEPGTFRSEKN